MTSGKSLIKNTFKLKETKRTPWVPFVGCHGGELIGVNAQEYLQSEENLVSGVSRAIELYKPDGIPVIFDLQAEAEILGCKLSWSENNPPSVVSHPLIEGTKLEDLHVPNRDEGRIPIILSAATKLRKAYPGISLYGLITGPLTLSLHLMGTDIFLKMFDDPSYIKKLLEFSRKVCNQMAGFYIESGCDVIAVVDPMTSQIDETSFAEFVKDPISNVFEHIRNLEALSSFFVCGNAQHNIEGMCRCNPDNISIDENIPLEYVKEVALKNNISFGGNLKLTSVLLLGMKDSCKKHTVETLDRGGKKGFVLSPGCDLPMSTPEENLAAVSELVHDSYQQEIIRRLDQKPEDIHKMDLSDHFKSGYVVLDVITLDSASCAPCQYMMEIVKHAVKKFGRKVKYNEYKIKNRSGLQMMASLGVKNVPAICINGNIEFSSRIPNQTELEDKIEDYFTY